MFGFGETLFCLLFATGDALLHACKSMGFCKMRSEYLLFKNKFMKNDKKLLTNDNFWI